MMKNIAKELLSETKLDKEIEERDGGLSSKIRETSTTWKIPRLCSIKTIGQAQEGVFHQEEEKEDLRKSQITIQEIHTFTAFIMVGATAPKLAQKPKRT
jgi:hypothetical protein